MQLICPKICILFIFTLKIIEKFIKPKEQEKGFVFILFDWIKNTVNWVKDEVVDTPFYQQTIRPTGKQGVNALIDNFVPAPERDIAHKPADFAGDNTGAFGLKSHRRVALSNDMSHFISPMHPAMNPGLPLRPIGGATHHKKPVGCGTKRKVKRRGKSASGSFLAAGY